MKLPRWLRFAEKPTEQRALGPNVYQGTVTGWATDDWDKLIEQKGRGIYREMYLRDDMVRASVMTLQLAALSPGWKFTPAEETEADAKAAAFAEYALDAMKGQITQTLRELMDPLVCGFMVAEPVWTTDTEGDWAGYSRIGKLKLLDPAYIKFDLDQHGEIREQGIWQEVQGFTTSAGQYIKFDPAEVVYWNFDAADGNPYGNSLLRSAWPHYMGKIGALREWTQYLERMGRPMPHIGYPMGADSDHIATARAFLKEFRTTNYLLHPDGWPIDFLQAAHTENVAFFEAFFKLANRGIARSLLLPALVLENTESGSWALGKEHTDQLVMFLRFIDDMLEDVVNTQVVQPMHKANFPPTVKAPRFEMLPLAQDDEAKIASVVSQLVGAGVTLAEDEVRERLSWRTPEEGEAVIGGPIPRNINPLTGEALEAVPEGPPPARFAERADVEQFCTFAETNQAEDAAIELWGSTLAWLLEESAREVEAGKAPGARPPR